MGCHVRKTSGFALNRFFIRARGEKDTGGAQIHSVYSNRLHWSGSEAVTLITEQHPSCYFFSCYHHRSRSLREYFILAWKFCTIGPTINALKWVVIWIYWHVSTGCQIFLRLWNERKWFFWRRLVGVSQIMFWPHKIISFSFIAQIWN